MSYDMRGFLLGAFVAVLATAAVIPCISFMRRADANVPSTVSAAARKAPAGGPKRAPKPRGANRGRVRVAGVMVNGPVHFGAPTDEKRTRQHLAFYGTMARTRIALNLRLPAGEDRRIVRLDRKASKVLHWRDDLGQDVLDDSGFGGPYEMMPRVSDDGRDIVCHLSSKRQPKPGAQAMDVKGELALLVSKGQATTTSEPVEIAANNTFVCAPYSVKITTIDEQRGKPTLTIRMTQDPAAIQSWALVDPDENVIELNRSMSMSGGGTWTISLRSKKPLPRLGALRLRAWTAPETMRVPYEVRATLSLR